MNTKMMTMGTLALLMLWPIAAADHGSSPLSAIEGLVSGDAGASGSCGPVYDGDVCTFSCVTGNWVHVSGHNNFGSYDYDGYADCGGAYAHCRAANGEDGCTARSSTQASFSSSSGQCYAYNDWGPTESTSCWTS